MMVPLLLLFCHLPPGDTHISVCAHMDICTCANTANTNKHTTQGVMARCIFFAAKGNEGGLASPSLGVQWFQ